MQKEKCLLLGNPGSVKSGSERGSLRLSLEGLFFCPKAKIKALLCFKLNIANTQLMFQRVHPTMKVSGVLKHFGDVADRC